MACRMNRRTAFSAQGFHPYACSVRPKRAAKRAPTPLFADISVEIIRDIPGEVTPSWMVLEEEGGYSLVVSGRTQRREDVEVLLEAQLNIDNPTPRDRLHLHSMLTVFCERAAHISPQDWRLATDVPDSFFTQWNHVRKFWLPLDADADSATAAHENGVLTVRIPRDPGRSSSALGGPLPYEGQRDVFSGWPKESPVVDFQNFLNVPLDGQTMPTVSTNMDFRKLTRFLDIRCREEAQPDTFDQHAASYDFEMADC